MFGIGLLKGLFTTLKNLLGPVFTVQYPNKKVGLLGALKFHKKTPFQFLKSQPTEFIKSLAGLHEVPEYPSQATRFRGQDFNWFEDRCTGCASCAKYCPLGIIKIVTDTSGINAQEGQSYDIDTFDIDIGRCMFCGLCVEACPYDALHMGSGFEEGTYKRDDLVIDVERLKKADKKPSTWFRPQLTDQGHDPIKGSNATWEQVGRHEKPTLKEQQDRWANR